MKSIQKNTQLDTIQGLRAAAALLVVFDHAVLTLIARADFPDSYKYFAGALGDSGVFLFFSISGFIMMYTSYSNFAVAKSPYNFILRRIMRIVPFYWLCICIYWIKLIAENKAPGTNDIIRSFLFIPYLNSEGLTQPVYPLGWTLNYEMFFYAMFAAALFFKRSTGILVTISVFALLVMIGNYTAPSPETNILLYFYTKPIILYFASGILIFLIWKKIPEKFCPAIPSDNFYLIFLTTCFLFTVVIFYRYDLQINAYQIFSAIFFILLYSTVGTPKGNWDSKLWKIVKLLGDASFSIYLTHSFVLGPLGRIWTMLKINNDLWVAFCLIAMIAASILGYLSYIFIEQPLMQVTRRFLPKKPQPLLQTNGQTLP